MVALPACLFLLALLTLDAFQGAAAIDCYDCISVDGSNEACEDEFHQDLSTVHLITRDCMYQHFSGTHCYKFKGFKADGTRIIVRDCADADWGNNCADIRFIQAGVSEIVKGCLVSCEQDGCNRGAPGVSSPWTRGWCLLPVAEVLLAVLLTGWLCR